MITTTPWNEYYNNIIYVRTPAPHLIDINVSGTEKRVKKKYKKTEPAGVTIMQCTGIDKSVRVRRTKH